MAYATASGSTHAPTTAPAFEERGRQPPAMASAVPPKHLPTRARQFAAVLHKNYLLQTRSRRLWIGGAGWLALLIEVRSALHASKLLGADADGQEQTHRRRCDPYLWCLP